MSTVFPAPPQGPWIERHLGTVIAIIVAVIALVGTLASAYFQSQANQYVADQNFRAAQRQSDIKMVEIAVGILRSPVTDDLAQIRTWAMDIIDAGSTRKFTKDERSALLKKSLPAEMPAFAPCSPEMRDKSPFVYGIFCSDRDKYSGPRPMPFTPEATPRP